MTKNKIQKNFLGQEIPAIDESGLRQFGLVFAAIVAGLFGLTIPFVFNLTYLLWPWIVAVLFAVTAMLAPKALGPFYQIWMRFGVIMNIIMSRIILGTVFILTVVPIGLIFKMRGKDILDLRIDKASKSYRKSIQENIPNDMRKPY